MYGDRFVLSTHSIGFTDSISHQISELNEYIPSEMKEHDWNDVEILLGQLKIAKSNGSDFLFLHSTDQSIPPTIPFSFIFLYASEGVSYLPTRLPIY